MRAKIIRRATLRTPLCVFSMAVVALASGCGLRHFSIAEPNPPAIHPASYYDNYCKDSTAEAAVADPTKKNSSYSDYCTDLIAYEDATNPAKTPNLAYAKQKRNDIAYGLMSQIEVVYGAYYNHLFLYQSAVAIGSDSLTLGMTAAASIATNKATKTLFSALGTGIAGIGLSAQKNLFAQQAFPIIGLAMETRRDAMRTQILTNLANDVTTYPLNAVKRDLVSYLNAGTLPGGLQELQSEAGAANASQVAKTKGVQAAAPPTGVQATPGPGDAQITVSWTLVSGADAYNVYSSPATGVTTTNGSQHNVKTNSFTDSGLTDGNSYYYIVTSVAGTIESAASSQVTTKPQFPPVAGSAPQALTATPEPSAVMLTWLAPAGNPSFKIYYSTSTPVTKTNGTLVPGTITSSPYTVTGLDSQKQLYFAVSAMTGDNESALCQAATPATPLPPSTPPPVHSLPIH